MKPDPSKFPSPLSQSDSKKSAANSRWKWMAGSSAASLAAASTTGFAAPVQITQVGSVITPNSGMLDADLTKDGVDDLDFIRGSSAYAGPQSDRRSLAVEFTTLAETRSSVQFQGKMGSAFFVRGKSVSTGPVTYNRYRANAGALAAPGTNSFNTAGMGEPLPEADVFGMIWVNFKDSRINGGNPVKGLMEARTRANANGVSLQIVRLIFDEADPDNFPNIAAGAPRLTEYVSPAEKARIAARKKKLKKDIRNLGKKQKAAQRKGKKALAKRLGKKIRRLKAQLRRL